MISASGFSAGSSASTPPSTSGAMARPKATVLPLPVCALTRRSRPAASGTSTASCTEVSAA